MLVNAKIISTICGNVVLIFRSVLIRLRAIVGVYEEAIEGEYAFGYGRRCVSFTGHPLLSVAHQLTGSAPENLWLEMP
jgi:hypothetical protein